MTTKSSIRRLFHAAQLCGTITIALGLVSCDPLQYTSAISDFATACTNVTQQTKNAYHLVNETVMQQKIDELADKDPPPVDWPKRLTPQISDENLKIRQDLLDGLQGYATALANLTGKTPTALDDETTKLAASLSDLADNKRLQHSFRETKLVTKEELNIAATGVDFIGKFLINRTITKNLPANLAKAAPSVNKISTLLADEIGGAPGDKDGGFREVVADAFDKQLMVQDRIITEDPIRSAKRRDDLAVYGTILKNKRTADTALANTREALMKIGPAHDALLKASTAPATFTSIIAQVQARARDAQDFYGKLPTK
jgi:hypothetical protein